MNSNPVDLFRLWYEEAEKAVPIYPSAFVLATANVNCVPSARILLLKSFGEEGFSFFTDYESVKGKELASNPLASMVFYWKEMRKQVRISGSISKLSKESSVSYFRSRDRESRLSALCSKQSFVMERGSTEFQENLHAARIKFEGLEIPKPERWGGLILIPDKFEFWTEKDYRRHIRVLYTKNADSWDNCILYP